ncbi:MAG: helix-turn-helix domain-containing protein [Candidatus Nitrosopolaris sp.]|jgi:intein-encoded DNA endonuclease-like protein
MTALPEKYVIRLYKENKSITEIAKLMHMSFRTIGAIINRSKSEAERERGYTNDKEIIDTEPKSKVSQAFRMFLEGKKTMM